MRILIPVFLLASCTTDAAEPVAKSVAPEGFWEHWGDGRAELAGYRLTQPRYGEPRRGEAVLVFVTEEFTKGDRVKSDGGNGDEYPVIKLNETRDFQTGVYDYNAMTSAFVRLDGKDALGVPTKVSFGSQEWCGHVYDQIVTHDDRYQRTSHSYFDGEADRSAERDIPSRAVFLDALPIYARGLAGELVGVGESSSVALHPRLMDLRFAHRDADWLDATVSRVPVDTAVVVPAGEFEVDRVSIQAGAQVWAYDIERAAPNRLIRWTGPSGELGELTGTVRTDYWNKSGEGFEKMRAELGLGEPSWLRGD